MFFIAILLEREYRRRTNGVAVIAGRWRWTNLAEGYLLAELRDVLRVPQRRRRCNPEPSLRSIP